jgi:metal-sulfur cluster biosynthetic enzyme
MLLRALKEAFSRPPRAAATCEVIDQVNNPVAQAGSGGSEREALIRHALRGVIDPEIGRSVIDVGLIYAIRLRDDGVAEITMTTTIRGCPATDYLVDAVRERAESTSVAGIVEVKLTYDPPWSPSMMAD